MASGQKTVQTVVMKPGKPPEADPDTVPALLLPGESTIHPDVLNKIHEVFKDYTENTKALIKHLNS